MAVPEPLPEVLEGRRERNGVFETLRHRNWVVPEPLPEFLEGSRKAKGDSFPVECNFFRWIYPFITMSFFNLPKYRVYSSFHGLFLVNTYFRTRQNRFHRKGLPFGNPFLLESTFFLFRNFTQSIGQCCSSQIYPNDFSISIDQIIGRNGTNAPSRSNI